MKNIKYLSAVLFLLVFTFSCDVGLGTRLNLDPPVVKIENPGFMEMISDVLVIEGTASDFQEIVLLEVTVERVSKTGGAWKQEWVSERGAWRSSNNEAEWVLRDGDEGIEWRIAEQSADEGVKYEWKLTIPMESAEDGEYLITAGAENNVYNRGPLEQRRVIIDKDGPITSILLPDLETNAYNSVLSLFNSYTLENPSILNRLFNQNIRIQYEIADNFSIDKIKFELADHDGNIYYDSDEFEASWSGRHVIEESEIKNPDGSNLDTNRNSRYFLQIVSYAYDKAGNEQIASHGWFVYWPESDRPWVTGVGHPNNPRDFDIYPGSDIQLLSYDDDGVKQVTYSIFDFNTGSQADEPLISETLENIPRMEGSNPSTFFSFGIKAPEKAGAYLIRLECIDINGLHGITRDRYFYIVDTSMPDIEIDEPNRNESLFGNNTGNFTFEGTVSDGVNPVNLKLAWIKPGNITDQFLYQNIESALWNSTGDDGSGNKVWDLTSTMGTPSSVDGRTYRSFLRSLNLFTDLGINGQQIVVTNGKSTGGVPLGTQVFVFRIQGQNGNAITRLYNIRGDITPPDLSISRVRITSGASYVDYQSDFFDDHSNQMQTLKEGDTVTLFGSWDDDSFNVWSNTGRYTLAVTWNGSSQFTLGDGLTSSISTTLNSNKTWQAGPFTLNMEEATKGGGRAEARLLDWGRNMATASLSARADSNVPVLMAITSETPDGSYRAGSVIDINLDFNKRVRFTGSTPPSLDLGGGRNAIYQTALNNDPQGTTRHIFHYTVQNTDMIDKLNVASFTGVQAGYWIDGSNMQPIMSSPPSGRNLSNSKTINIDTSAPAMTGVVSLNDADSYRAGQTLYIRVDFDKEINFVEGTENQTTLGFLNLGSGIRGVGRNPMLLGQKSLLFTYQVLPGDNTLELQANSFTFGMGSSITDGSVIRRTPSQSGDDRGNLFTFTSIPSGNNIHNGTDGKTIIIDTDPPSPPTLNAPAVGPHTQAQTFTITGESGADLEYQIGIQAEAADPVNWGPWMAYNGTQTISSAAIYSIRARQTDKAGNQSNETAISIVRIIRNENILMSLGGSNPGTYTINNTIEVRLNLNNSRGTIGVTGTPTLTLNIANGSNTTRTVNFTEVSGASLVFRFNAAAGDSVDTLEINSINLTGSTITAGTANINGELEQNWTELNLRLSQFTSITIRTDIPAVQGSPALSEFTQNPANDAPQQTLTILFTKPVIKGTTGDASTRNITLTQSSTTPYLAPAVMSLADFDRWNTSGANLGSYYTLGTNGTTAAGVPDLTPKYILNWDIEPNNSTLTGILTARGANRVTIPVMSGAVTIDTVTNAGVERGRMVIDLSNEWGYNLRIRGVRYDLSLGQNIVRDMQGNPLSAADAGTARNVINPGVNDPFIRIQKNRGTWGTATVRTPGTESTTTVTTGTRYIRNAPNRFSEERPTDEGDWIQLPVFHIRVPQAATNIIYTTAATGRISLQDIRSNNGGIQGHVFNNNGTITFGWSGSGEIYNSNNNTGTAFINLHEHVMYAGDRWQDRDINIRNLWINIAAGTTETAPPAGQIGWFIIPGTTTTVTTETGGSNITTPVISQPRTASVRIDTQTFGAQIRYREFSLTQDPQEGTSASPFNGTNHPATPAFPSPTQLSAPEAVNNNSGVTFAVGFSDVNDYRGIVVGVRAFARSQAGGIQAEGVTSGTVYNRAARSVIQFDYTPQVPAYWNTLRGIASTNNRVLQLWLRGGDDVSGQNAIEGFPLSWHERDYSGIRLMTNTNPGGSPQEGIWYWMSWEITDTAYFYFMAGSTGVSTAGLGGSADVQANGPVSWAWGKNAWAVQQAQYPLHPGGSLRFIRNTNVASPATQYFEFYSTFSGSR